MCPTWFYGIHSSYYHAVLKTQQSQAILDFCVTKTRLGKSHDLSRRHHFRKAPLSKFFPFTPKQKACVFKFLRFKGRNFRKAPFSWQICCVTNEAVADRTNEAVFSSLEGPSILRARSTLPDNEYNEYKYFKVC